MQSMIQYDRNFLDKTEKYLLNNSTDLSTTEEYNKRKQRISESPVWGLGFMKKVASED